MSTMKMLRYPVVLFKKKKGQVFEPFLDLMTCKTKVKDSESTSYPVTCCVALAEQRWVCQT